MMCKNEQPQFAPFIFCYYYVMPSFKVKFRVHLISQKSAGIA